LLIHACATRGVPFVDAMWYLSWFLAVAYLLYFSMTYLAVLSHESR